MGKRKKYALLTTKNWPQKFKVELDSDFSMLYGYLECIEREIPVFEEMIRNAKSFEELREGLQNFIKEQNELVNDIKVKRSSDDANKYGLPQIPGP